MVFILSDVLVIKDTEVQVRWILQNFGTYRISEHSTTSIAAKVLVSLRICASSVSILCLKMRIVPASQGMFSFQTDSL